ncbi:hypothetical protein PF005_g32307 [Phytophthora fragariae]|uniref:Uncharacterized protein n=1 Tax=Phytophthora fragariae TaxID=53985 RepID=A0A6A3V0Y8_9STRA|nr:hypothetical protein PF005_g32307 [Phytophthora fragariae]
MLSWAKSTNSGYNYQNKTVSCCFNGVCRLKRLCLTTFCTQFFSLSQTEVVLVLELLDRSCRSRTRPT